MYMGDLNISGRSVVIMTPLVYIPHTHTQEHSVRLNVNIIITDIAYNRIILVAYPMLLLCCYVTL